MTIDAFDAKTRVYEDKLLAPRSQRLGEALIAHKLIDRVQLFEALNLQQRHGSRLGDVLVWLGHISRDTLEIVAAGRGPVEPVVKRYAPPVSPAPKRRSAINKLDTTRVLQKR
ncbi:MAG: hypothetical protein CSA65_04635 [Proteobacteria bacterium]|nr:MAG: hypothetical protein CSB49_02905 [Pseudomonadota bacterium]PIE18574.1 MAG: hypothetical protein CSA65_04635 [Pseudomonadota bacterium]